MQRLLAFVLLLFIAAAAPVYSAIESRDTLKTYFETGDIPTQDDFVDLIDSIIDLHWEYQTQNVHSLNVQPLGGGLVVHSDGSVDMLHPGDVVGPSSTFAFSTLIDSALHLHDDRYLLGLRLSIDNPGGFLTTHYGFVDLSVDGPSSPTRGAIHIFGFSYESSSDTAITAHFIPSPNAALFGLPCFALLALRRSRR